METPLLMGLIIAAIVGFLIGRDAESRGMSGIGWGVFTFVICIVAVPIYLEQFLSRCMGSSSVFLGGQAPSNPMCHTFE
jgi:hypothetical protein